MDNDNYSLSTTSSTIIMMTRAFIYVMYIYVSVCLPGGFDLDTFGVFFLLSVLTQLIGGFEEIVAVVQSFF